MPKRLRDASGPSGPLSVAQQLFRLLLVLPMNSLPSFLGDGRLSFLANDFGDSGVAALAAALQEKTSLTELT